MRRIFCLLLLLLLLFSSGCNTDFTDQPPISATFLQFDTSVTITLYATKETTLSRDELQECLEECRQLCIKYEEIFSRTLENSEIYRMNHTYEAGVAYPLSSEAYELLTYCHQYSRITNGAFSPFLAPLTGLWDFAGSKVPPEAESLASILPLLSHRDVLLKDGTITFAKEGMGVDVGASAKGYIADRLKEHLVAAGVTSGVISLGGNVLCIGEKPDGSPFRIGIQKPFGASQETAAVLDVRDRSVVSSGIYERYFMWEDRLYHHILNPATGYPYDNELLGVTILSDSSLQGDVLSTSCFALGLEKGMELLAQYPEAEGIFITKDYELHYTWK